MTPEVAPAGPARPGRPPLGETADKVRSAALGVPGVLDLHGGALGEVGVYLPGRLVSGVRLREDRTEVHVVLDLSVDLNGTARLLQQAVAGVRPGRVDVTIADVREADDENQPD